MSNFEAAIAKTDSFFGKIWNKKGMKFGTKLTQKLCETGSKTIQTVCLTLEMLKCNEALLENKYELKMLYYLVFVMPFKNL